MNPYIDIKYVDRTYEIEEAFEPTLEDVQNNPQFYTRLVIDLMSHWIHGTRETATMINAKDFVLNLNKKS